MHPELEQLLHEASIDLGAIALRGGSAWLFGSRASACARRESDWDLLIIDTCGTSCERTSLLRQPCLQLDVVFVDSDVLQAWCGSELASHVAAYGRQLIGGQPIIARPIEAAPRKLRVVRNRAALLERLWNILQPTQRHHEVTRVRRDAQRAWHLANGWAVPPTAFLDDQWFGFDASEQRAVLTCCALVPDSRHTSGSVVARNILELTRTPEAMAELVKGCLPA